MTTLSINQPNVLVTIISFKYNFLAEGVVNCLQSDPDFNWPVMVINTGKDPLHAALFKTYEQIKNVFFRSGWSHSSTLNALTLSHNFYAYTKGYDWLVMVDHDVFFTEPGFQQSVKRILARANQCSSDKEPLIIAPFSAFPGKIFNTNPIMLLNVKENARSRWYAYNQNWNVEPNFSCDGDTGQLLGQKMLKTNSVWRFNAAVMLPDNIHIGSSWFTIDTNSHLNSVAMLLQSRRERLICPSLEDIELMVRDGINPLITEALRGQRFSSL